MSIRPVKRIIKAKPALEGAGVHLRRAFGFGNTSDFDPFSFSTTSATTFRRTTWPAFRGIPTGVSRRSPTSLRAPWSTATAWGTTAPSPPATSSG